MRANASKRKAMSYARMLKEEARLKEEIQRLLDNAGAVDAEEDERYCAVTSCPRSSNDARSA